MSLSSFQISEPRRVTGIAAMSLDHVIGVRTKLPWHIKEDLQHFKNFTRGKTVVIGKRTWQGMNSTLEGRQVLVLGKEPLQEKNAPHVRSVRNREEALLFSQGEELIIAGGAKTYETFYPFMTHLVLTIIRKNYADQSDPAELTFMPEPTGNWELTKLQPLTEKKESGLEVIITSWERKKT